MRGVLKEAMSLYFALAPIALSGGARTAADVVDTLLERFLSMPVGQQSRATMIRFLEEELGTSDIARATSYIEDPLRQLVHLIMSTPEYQLT